MIRIYNKFWLILILLYIYGGKNTLGAQEINGDMPLDLEMDYYSVLSLPPLDVLFENSKTAPVYELADVTILVEKSLLAKERRAFLGWFSIRGSWQYGNFTNDASYSDIVTPTINTYNTAEQTTYSVGAGVNIPLDAIFDLGPRVKRQKLHVRAAELQKELAYQELKTQILDLYLKATSQLSVVKIRAQAVVLANEQYRIVEKNFANGVVGSDVLTNEKEKQSVTFERYEGSRSELTRSIMTLELITNTPIIKK